MRLLLVEDDRMIGEGLRSALRQAGFAVDWVRDGRGDGTPVRAVPAAKPKHVGLLIQRDEQQVFVPIELG